ncbi:MULTISPECIES: hypothetical protein [Paenibacillus]|uniref:hypothetical protein n=1 Tax=Paenibacillus TaxID=44249 RepID=UPI0012BB6DC8|nr:MULTISPECIES: hypothetical protein [Paenibacillus]
MRERQLRASFYARDAVLPAPLLHMLAADEPPENGLWFNIGFGIGFGGGQGMFLPSM